MIVTTQGAAVLRFLEDVRLRPERYAEFVICSPFIDVHLSPLVIELAERAYRAQRAFRIITRPPAAAMLLAALPGPNERWKTTVRVHGNLHAKVYLGLRRGGPSNALVTSANLTLPGLETNVELGVRAESTSPAGRQLVHQVRRFLQKLAYFETSPYNPTP